MRQRTNPKRDKQFLDSTIYENGLIPLLNDRKWVKTLETLVKHRALIKKCYVKLIWEQGEVTRELLLRENARYEFDYYEHSMEAMITGNPKGWYDYREIEWLDFPREIKGDAAGQDPEKIYALFKNTGTFQLDLQENNLRVYAYLKEN